MNLPQHLDDFAGTWRLERVINDTRAGRTMTGEGMAAFGASAAGGLTYDESLTLSLPGLGPIHATRRYLWRCGADGRIEVCFADGRPFHALRLGVASCDDLHECPPDRYEGRYDFGAWPDWRATWTVLGPRKDYVMQTRYRRPAG